MSLVGYVPPFPGAVDEHGNVTSLLVDGGYCLMFPVAKARNLGAGSIITVDVAALYSELDPNFGDTCSGWNLLWKYLMGDGEKIPMQSKIEERITNMWNIQRHKVSIITP